jgi:hypothetical protein
MEDKRPLFGVITTTVAHRHGPKTRSTSYRPGAIWCELEQRAFELGMTTCIFRPEDLDMARECVHGWVCSRKGDDSIWRRVKCRLPDVVYENVYVHLSATGRVKRIRRFFEQKGIPLFNPRLGDKAELADWLRSYPELWKHHPETERLTDASQVLEFIGRHRSVYLKPVLGSAGRGIIEIRQQEEDGYLVQASKYGRKMRALSCVMKCGEMLKFVRKEIKRGRYILQAGCDLIWINSGKIDVRTHLQRNQDGEWECVGLIVKRGRPHSIVSNYHAGGSSHSWYWLKRWAKQNAFPLPGRSELLDLSIALCKAYTEKAPRLASLGLDLGIDQNGEIWLLDVNSRPGRNILEPEQKVRCQHLNAEFACYLTKRPAVE